MKNILVVDEGGNCAYDIFSVSERLFKLVFPRKKQDIEFAEDLWKRVPKKKSAAMAEELWKNPIRKRDAKGIHGILFFGLTDKKRYYPNKRDSDLDGRARAWISEPKRYSQKLEQRMRQKALK